MFMKNITDYSSRIIEVFELHIPYFQGNDSHYKNKNFSILASLGTKGNKRFVIIF